MSELHYGIVVQLEFFPSWLSLSREERRNLAQDMYAIIDKYAGKVAVEFYDSDALHGQFTDFVICRTTNLKHYSYMWEELRDTTAYAQGYLKIRGVTIGIRNGHQSFEAEELGMQSY